MRHACMRLRKIFCSLLVVVFFVYFFVDEMPRIEFFAFFSIASNGMLCWLHSNDTTSIQLEIFHWFYFCLKYNTQNIPQRIKMANDINIEERDTVKIQRKIQIFRTMCSEWIGFLMQILSRQIESHFTLALKWGLFILNKYYVSDLHSWYAQYLHRLCVFFIINCEMICREPFTNAEKCLIEEFRNGFFFLFSERVAYAVAICSWSKKKLAWLVP